MTQQEGIAYAKLKEFCANIVKKLAPPQLKEVQASTLRPDAEPFTPWRMTRATKKSSGQGVAKATPAENVLLKALGMVPGDMAVDEQVMQELKGMFDSPLREQHIRVIPALFGKIMPISGNLSCRDSVLVGAH